MFKLILGFVLISPLIGIMMMEAGFFGMDVGMEGHPNGATEAFLLYIFVLLITAFLFRKVNLVKMRKLSLPTNLTSILIFSAIVNTFFLLLMLFAFGGIFVLLGSVNKGEFRTSFGFFGFLPYLIIRYFSPVLLAYVSILYMKAKDKSLKPLFILNFFLTGMIGMTFGFKSTSVTMIIPALIILLWDTKLITLLKVGVVAMFFFVFTSVLFDRTEVGISNFDLKDVTNGNALAFIIYRLTVLQGNTAWLVWDKSINGDELPSYWPTLFAAFGDKALSIFGVDLSDLNTFAKYHFDILLTSLVSNSYDSRLNGHNITGTAFSDGVFIGGIKGVVFIAVIAGVMVGQAYNLIKSGIKQNNALIGSLTSVYFGSFIFQWLNGGGITVLFHISTLFGLGASVILLLLTKSFLITKNKVLFKFK